MGSSKLSATLEAPDALVEAGGLHCRFPRCVALAIMSGYCLEHLRVREPATWTRTLGVVGRVEPRLYTPPLRPLTRATSRGFERNDFADQFGQPDLPWQRWLNVHALELLPDDTYRFKVVIVLVARQNGKSTAKRKTTLWRMYLDGARNVLGVAQDLPQAREQWSLCQETIQESPELADEFGGVRNVNGDEKFWLANGAKYLIRAMNRKAGRGYTFFEINIDELREQRDWTAWSAVSKTIMAVINGQIWCMSNAGDDLSVVLNQLREAGLAGRDDSIGIFEWSGPEGCDLDDPCAIAQANPSLGHTITMASIRSAAATDPPDVFRTEVLCQRVETLNGAFDMGAWSDCRDSAGTLASARDRVVAGVDVAPDGQHVTLTAAAVVPDGRVRGEVVDAWESTESARFQLGDQIKRVNPAAVVWFPSGPAAALSPVIRAFDNVIEIKGAEVAAVCMGLADLIRARRVIHPGDPLLDTQAAGARRLDVGEGWRYIRLGAGHVDGMYAFAGAVHGALTLPVARPLARSQVY